MLLGVGKRVGTHNSARHADLRNGGKGGDHHAGIALPTLQPMLKRCLVRKNGHVGELLAVQTRKAPLVQELTLLSVLFLIGNIGHPKRLPRIAVFVGIAIPRGKHVALLEDFRWCFRKMRNITVARGVNHRADAVSGPSRFVFHAECLDPALLQLHVHHVASVENIHTILDQLLLSENGKDLCIIPHLVALVLLGARALPVQPVFGILGLRAVGNGELQQLLGNTKGHLTAVSVAKRKIGGNQSRRGQTAKHILLFQQKHPSALSCGGKCGRDAGNSSAANGNVVCTDHLCR